MVLKLKGLLSCISKGCVTLFLAEVELGNSYHSMAFETAIELESSSPSIDFEKSLAIVPNEKVPAGERIFELLRDSVTDPAFLRGVTLSCSIMCCACFFSPALVIAQELVLKEVPKKRTWAEWGKNLKHTFTHNLQPKVIYNYYRTYGPTTKTITLFVIGSLVGTTCTVTLERVLGLTVSGQGKAFYQTQIQELSLALALADKRLIDLLAIAKQNLENHNKAYKFSLLFYRYANSTFELLKKCGNNPDRKTLQLPTLKQIASLKPLKLE